MLNALFLTGYVCDSSNTLVKLFHVEHWRELGGGALWKGWERWGLSETIGRKTPDPKHIKEGQGRGLFLILLERQETPDPKHRKEGQGRGCS